MLQALQIDPTVLAYKILNGPYDWNGYPLALLGCKAVVYKDGDTHSSWASQGVDAFISALRKIITDVKIITSQKQGLTIYLAGRNHFCNIANYLC